MSTLAATYSWATDEAALKTYLGISGSTEDAQLQPWYEAAIEHGDHYLGNPFVDSDGDDVTHPVGIRLGLYHFVQATRVFFRGNAKPGMIESKTGQVSEKYSLAAALTPALAAAVIWWSPHRLDMGIGETAA